MSTYFGHIRLDQPALYIIKVQGRFEDNLTDWLQGEPHFAVETGPEGNPVTSLVGSVADQAALHGLLVHIRDLGLVLLHVECLTGNENWQSRSENEGGKYEQR